MRLDGGWTGESQFVFGPAGEAAGTPGFVTVPDAHLLFHADFKRSGSDLKLVGEDGKTFLVPDYFSHEKRPTLLSPEGAQLTPNVVEALAGPLAPGQYAQAGGAPAGAQAIGRVAKAEGNATVVRNGVAITLNTGDAVLKGDVAQTGDNSALSLVLTDGTTFSMTSGARMVLNEFVYSPGGANNSALVNLVQGSITFLAGQVAKTGDMKVDTPVATMGIRGTLVKAELNLNLGNARFTVLTERDGTTGSYVLINKTTGQIIATVSQAGVGYVLQPSGPLAVIAQQFQLTAAELQAAFQAMQTIFNDQQIGQQILQQNPVDDTKSNPGTNGSGTPPSVLDKTAPPNSGSSTPIFDINVPNPGGTLPPDPNFPPSDVAQNPAQDPAAPITVPLPSNLSPFFETQTPTVTRISVEGEHSFGPRVSDNGRFIVFIAADKLPQESSGDSGDHDPSARVYIYDRETGTLRSMTDHLVGAELHEGESFPGLPSISADGRLVAIEGDYQNTVVIDGNEQTFTHSEIFLYNSETDTTILLARNAWGPSISADGKFVAFTKFVSDEGGQGAHEVVQVLDLTKPDHPIVATIEGPGGDAMSPALDASGQYITFIGTDADGVEQIYLFDLHHPELGPQLVSHTADGEGGNQDSGTRSDDESWAAGLSGDGRYVVFQSNASNLVTGDTNDATDIFLFDRETGAITLVSHNNDGASGNGHSIRPEISPDGRYIAFISDADNLVAGDTNDQPDVFVYDQLTGDTRLVSVGATFAESNGNSEWGVSVTSGGVFTVFGSEASNLVDGDTNDHSDIFVTASPNVVDDPTKTALTDQGTLAFTDTNDTHTVSFQANPAYGPAWGSLSNLQVSTDTTGTNTDGRITWNYTVNRNSSIAALGAGETHIDHFLVTVTDSAGNTAVTSLDVTIVGVNDLPVITGDALGTPFVEGGSAVGVATNVSASDIDSTNYDGGSLTATITAGSHEGDRLSIANGNHISISGTTVLFDADGLNGADPVAIGTLQDNINSLTISFNSNADDATVEALTQSIQFQNTTQNPSLDDRTVTFTLTDGSGQLNDGQNLNRFDVTVAVDAPPDGFLGQTFKYQYYFPTSQSLYGDFTVTAGDGIEIGDNTGRDGAASVDFQADKIVFDFYANKTWASADFNGFKVSDINNSLDDIVSVHLNAESNMAGLTDANIQLIDADHFEVNWQGLSFNVDTKVVFDVQFSHSLLV